MTGLDPRIARLEIKYLIDESMADRLRRDVASFCEADAHNEDDRKRPGYSISSLYLDTPSFAFYQAKERGDPERLKLRVRTYGDSPTAVLEIKRKISEFVAKSRATVSQGDVERAAAGLIDTSDQPAAARRCMDEFAYIVAASGAQPTLQVRYNREAYVSVIDRYARVTFDRNIAARRQETWAAMSDSSHWCEFDDFLQPDQANRCVMLELKCGSSIPFWMGDLVRRHSLVAQSFSKYSIGIQLTGRRLGEQFISRRLAKVIAA
ncbi:MAG: polyphosphate polymerase domain-containing protein [Myxococcota bacterium]